MNPIKRREFISLAAVAAALPLKAIDEPQYKFPTEARKRIAVSSYPFRRLISTPHSAMSAGSPSGMTLQQFAQTIGPKLDVSGIEPWSPHFESNEESYVHSLRKIFDAAGVHVVNIPVDAKVQLCAGTEQREQGLAIYRKWVDAAVILGSPSIRVHLPRGAKDDGVSCAIESLRALAEYGASKHVVIAVENDSPDSEAPEKVVKVLRAVNSPYLRSLPDFCNSMLIHNDQAYNDKALASLYPLAFNISHVKDMEVDGDKVYRVDMDRIFAIARQAGYKGFFSIEWEGRGDEYIETKKLIAASLKNLAG
jgi:sugar phosphate isomerase/epimerase